MIPVRGFGGAVVAVLGLGRSGLSAARALRTGGARVVVWDDTPAARERAEAEGFDLRRLDRASAMEDVACLVTSPGIPHLYPQANPAITEALRAGVPVDNDIGLFFRSLGSGWDNFSQPPRVIAVTGSNGKSTTSALIHHILTATGRESQLAGNIGRGVLTLIRRAMGALWCWSCPATRPIWPGASPRMSLFSRIFLPITWIVMRVLGGISPPSDDCSPKAGLTGR
jgi:UDP-N-acetylmuramoylalanine--D-glutamate ligase